MTYTGLERWFAEQGAPATIDLARSGAPGMRLGELCAAIGVELAEFDDLSLDYGPGAGDERLRREVADYLDVADPATVVICHGAVEALLLLLLTRNGGEVLVAGPAYSGLTGSATATNRPIRRARIWTPAAGLDAGPLLEAIGATTDVVIVNSPHNPSGARLSLTEIDRIAVRCETVGALLVVDEVARATLDPTALSATASAAYARGSVAVVGDVSKALGLGGLRVGWLATASPAIQRAAAAAMDATTVSGSRLSQTLAMHALAQRVTLQNNTHANALRNRRVLDQFVATVGGHWLPPEDGLVGFPQLPFPGGSEAFALALRRRDVGIVPGALFDHPERVRIGLGGPHGLFLQALELMADELSPPPRRQDSPAQRVAASPPQ